MRWADLTALFATVLWLGANLAIAFVPIVMFRETRIIGEGPEGVLLLRAQVGEMFGQVLHYFMYGAAALAGLLLIARVWGWTLRLRRGRFHRTSLIGVLLVVGVLTAFASGWTIVDQANALRIEAEIASDTEAPDADAIRTRFDAVHKQSERTFGTLTALLMATAIGLMVSLARRDPPVTASAPPAAA